MVVPGTKMSALSESDRCAPVASVAPLPQHVQSRDSFFSEWYPIDELYCIIANIKAITILNTILTILKISKQFGFIL